MLYQDTGGCYTVASHVDGEMKRGGSVRDILDAVLHSTTVLNEHLDRPPCSLMRQPRRGGFATAPCSVHGRPIVLDDRPQGLQLEALCAQRHRTRLYLACDPSSGGDTIHNTQSRVPGVPVRSRTGSVCGGTFKHQSETRAADREQLKRADEPMELRRRGLHKVASATSGT